MISFPNRAPISLPADQVKCDELLPLVDAAVQARTGTIVTVKIPGATRGTEVLLMRATALVYGEYMLFPSIVAISGRRDLRFTNGSPVYADPQVPADADPTYDATLAEAIAPAIAAKLEDMLASSALSVVHRCVDSAGNIATAGALKALLTAGRMAGFNSSMHFSEQGAPQLYFKK